MESLGSVVKASRVGLGLTQEELAKRSKLTRMWIAAVERDSITAPGWYRLQLLERALQLPQGRLLTLAGYGAVPEAEPVEEVSLSDFFRNMQRLAAEGLARAEALERQQREDSKTTGRRELATAGR